MPTTDLQLIADRVEIEALRGEYTDAAATGDHDRFAALFTPDALWGIPGVVEFSSRAAIRAGIERLWGHWAYLIQNTHPGTVRLAGDTATGRVYTAELGRLRDGASHVNHGVFHDRYRRTPDGWRFARRVYEIRYIDSTPLTGSAPAAGRDPSRDGGVSFLPGQDGPG